MSIDAARKFLIVSSLLMTGGQLMFLLMAPAFGYPLIYPKNLQILQIVSPVFLGYLGSASHFIFQTPAPEVPVQNQFLGMLVKGPLAIYFFVVVGMLTAYGYTNRVAAAIGEGISSEDLATALSLALGVLTVTTGVISSYLFVPPKPASG